MSRHTLGSLLVAGCALSWGFIGVIVRELQLPALTIVGFRVLFAVLSVLVVVIVLRRWDWLRPPAWPVLGIGALLAVHWGLFFAAIQETSVASAVLITYAAPIFIALLAPLLIGEPVPRVSLLALAVSAVGIALISLSGGTGAEAVRATGALLAVGAALSMAVLVIGLKRFSAGENPVTVVVYVYGTATALVAPWLLAPDYALIASDVGYLLVLGMVLTGWVGLLYVLAVRWIPATTVGILSYMEPVSAALLAALLLGEGLTPAVVGGGLAIVAAGVAVVLRAPEPVIEEPVIEEPVAVAARAPVRT